ncbi:hypothetical protein Mapa_002983 [Marchantia paleacea]|nr:hypothetical protein Mapa_002983 [Marchantia paleacea]
MNDPRVEVIMTPLSSFLDLKAGTFSAWNELVLEAALENQRPSEVFGYIPDILPPCMMTLDDHKNPPLRLTLLHLAAWTGDVSTIESLRTFPDLDVAATTEGGFTVLHLAASRGHLDALRILLEWSNVEVNAVSSEGFTALHMAAHGGHWSCVRLLLQKDSTSAHINARDEVLGRTALHWAVGHNSNEGLALVDLLLQNSEINPCPRDRAGFTPLHFASINSGEGEIPHSCMSLFLSLFHRPQLGEIPVNVIRKFMWGIPEKMVEGLLNKYPEQINFKVGKVETILSSEDVMDFNFKPWRKLWMVDVGEVHAARPGRRTVMGSNQFRNLSRSMSGCTALHFASSQNNAELVSYLLDNFPNIEVNEPDLSYGMTALHRTMWKGAMRSFSRLMSFRKVDVNARLKNSGQVEPQPWLPHHPVLDRLDENASDSFHEFRPGEFSSLETPLHLGIRFCAPEHFLKMITTFLKHPALDLTIRNDRGTLPLQLAWLRSDCTLVNSASNPVSFTLNFLLHPQPVPLISFHKKASETCIGRRTMKRYKASRELDIALDMLEEHPGNDKLIRKISSAMTATQQSVNAVLVTASVIAGFQFTTAAGLLLVNKNVMRAMRLYWTFYFLSFFFAIFTIFRCLGTTAISTPMSHRQVGNLESLLGYEQTRYTGPLHLCVLFGVGTFVTSGWVNIPQELHDVMWNCTCLGVVLVVVEAGRNLTGSYEAYLHGMVRQRIQKALLLHVPYYLARELTGLLLAPVVGVLALATYYRHVNKILQPWKRCLLVFSISIATCSLYRLLQTNTILKHPGISTPLLPAYITMIRQY